MLKLMEMKGNKVILIIVILIAGVFYILLFYQKKQIVQNYSVEMQKINTKVFQSSIVPTGAGRQNDPMTWSSYSYNHEFVISYPPNWNVVLDQDENGVSFMTAGFHQDDEFSMPYGNSYEVVYTIFGQNDISDMKLQNGDQFPSDTTSETLVVTHLQHLQISGFSAVEFDYYPTDNTNFLRTKVSILKGNKIYRFTATYATDTGKKLFEEMIKSLKFISS